MPSRFPAFVHDHPALSSLRNTQWADRFDFATVDPASFSPHEQLTRTPRFILLTADHLAYYNAAHNTVDTSPYNSPTPSTHLIDEKLTLAYALLQAAARADARPQPLLCFVDKKAFARDPVYAGIFRSLFSVEYHPVDHEGQVDVGELTRVAERRLEGSGRDMFLVMRAGEQYTVHCLGTDVTYVLAESSRMLTILRAAGCAFTEIPKIDGRRPLGRQSAGFRLCDRAGRPVDERTRFWLQVCFDHHDDYYDNDDDAVGPAGTRCLRFDGVLLGGVGDPSFFTHATVAGISYLMAGDRYLFVNEEDEITAAACLPAKSSRLQIEYNHRGDIMLSQWGGNAFATCEFDDNPVGRISFKTAGPSPYDEVWPMALRLHRVTTE